MLSHNQMVTGLELQRSWDQRETGMQHMGLQPAKPGGPLVRTEQSKDRTLEKTHKWLEREASPGDGRCEGQRSRGKKSQ